MVLVDDNDEGRGGCYEARARYDNLRFFFFLLSVWMSALVVDCTTHSIKSVLVFSEHLENLQYRSSLKAK